MVAGAIAAAVLASATSWRRGHDDLAPPALRAKQGDAGSEPPVAYATTAPPELEPESGDARDGDAARHERSRPLDLSPRLRACDALNLRALPQATARREALDAQRTTLVVEAPGYHPRRILLRPDERVDDGALVEVLLLPAELPARVVILARDCDGGAAPNLSVEAFLVCRREQSPPTRQSLWRRHSVAADGRHQLPCLPAGEVELTLSVTEANRLPRPVRTERRTILPDGSAGICERITFTPGAVPCFEFVRANGRSFDPATDGRLTLTLQIAGGPTTPRTWIQQRALGIQQTLDGISSIGTTWPSESLDPGAYLLCVRVDDELREQRVVHLAAGLPHLERVVLR